MDSSCAAALQADVPCFVVGERAAGVVSDSSREQQALRAEGYGPAEAESGF
jgi:hypothetical protein